MKQQVNLYQPIFRKQKKVFTAMAMLQVSLIAFALFAVIGGYSYLQLNKLEQQEASAKANLTKLQRQFREIEALSGSGSASKLLTSEINRIKREVEQKREIAAMLTQGPYQNTRGFSGQFEALARQHVQGAWLTRIEIGNGGGSVNLNGKTYSADLVPVYLGRLLLEQVFTGTSFNVLGMERSTVNPEEISFQVRTQTEGKTDGSS